MGAEITWEYCQAHSDELLCQAIAHLRREAAVPVHASLSCCSGNYLISIDGNAVYIGEAVNVQARLNQQFKVQTSTFYKNYRKSGGVEPIARFKVQTMETCIGRKEVEEFGISTIPCRLNRFQLGKRQAGTAAGHSDDWLAAQSRSTDLIRVGARSAMQVATCVGTNACPPTVPGIYLIRRRPDEAPIYVGESSDLAERWHKAHCRTTYFSALRRHIATELLGFQLQVRNGKAKYLESDEDLAVGEFLRRCTCAFVPVHFGRFELEEHLIRTLRPQLNRKSKSAIEAAE